MRTDRLQTQRFELKYQIDERTASAVREHVRALLVPDDFGGSRERPSYGVHSLYLDSTDLQLYRATLNGDRNRFKLRLRYYDERPDSPVYVEIKRRVDRCIHKQRARVRREVLAPLLAGLPPRLEHLAAPDARQLAALEAFCDLVRRCGAKPRAHVAYEREAWLSEANSVRVTFDRRVRCEPEKRLHLSTAFRGEKNVFDDRVVLELKFTNRFPLWLRDLVRVHGLQQASAAKYVDGVTQRGLTAFGAGDLAESVRRGAAPVGAGER